MKTEFGKVYIAGAGPGDPGLITVKALNKLKQADVVVYDRLINNDLLSYCRTDCEKIFVGKKSGHHLIKQERITNILINKAKAGLDVVRLKGGNPFIFGRGSEEASALKKAGIEFEIIPGITSGLSAPIYSGIPITQRGLITQCVLITAHESPDKPETQVEWDRLATLKNANLIIYMGASRIEKFSRKLIEHGMSPAMPAAVIENATLPKQRTITARLDQIAEEFKKHDFHAPAIIMISPSILYREKVSWYESKLLFNRRIVLMGKGYKFQASDLLKDLGAEILELPLISNKAVLESAGKKGKRRAEMAYANQSDENVFDDSEPGVVNTIISGFKLSGFTPEIYCNTGQGESDEMEIINDIKQKNADVFVFTDAASVNNFFNIYGMHASVSALSRSIVLATDKRAFERLHSKKIRNIQFAESSTSDELCSSICNLFKSN